MPAAREYLCVMQVADVYWRPVGWYLAEAFNDTHEGMKEKTRETQGDAAMLPEPRREERSVEW